MSGAQSCPRGHRSGRIVTDGELVIQGQEHIRYRCVLPDGSFHRFMAVASRPAQLAPSPPAPVASGGGRHAGPRLDDSTAFLPSQRSRRIAPTPGGVHPSLPVPPLVPPRPSSRPVVDRLAFDETTRLDPVAVDREQEQASPADSSERARRVLVLPSPPTDDEKYWYLGAQNRWFLWVGAGASLLVLASLVRFALASPITWAFLALVLLRVVTSAVGLVTSSRRRREDALDHEGRVATWEPLVYPSVDVFLPSAGEELEVLANTYLHISRLQWPGRLVVHVLDDAGRQDVADLAAGYGFRYQSRPDKGVMKKAGNLKYGFEHSAGDLIAVFDADFVPRPEYLFELVPYFEDPTVGIVQSPQFFDTGWRMNWLQRAAGATQELFYRFVQPARDAADAAICVGTCALYRRSALVKAGGFAQIGHSEDVHTGVKLLKVGFIVRYVPILVAKGLCPDTLSGFLNQQYRWCSGSMSLLIDRSFHAAPLNLRQRLCFWSGFLYYISTAVFVFTVTLPSLAMLWLFPAEIDVDNYRLLAPALTATYALTPLLMRGRWRPEVLRVQMIYSFAHAVAIFHTLRRRTADWVPTGAAGKGTPLAVTIRRLMTVTVLSGQALLWAGIARDFGALGVGRLWPMLVLAVVTAYVQLPALLPLQESRPDGALRRPPFPAPTRVVDVVDDLPTVFHARSPRTRVPAVR